LCVVFARTEARIIPHRPLADQSKSDALRCVSGGVPTSSGRRFFSKSLAISDTLCRYKRWKPFHLFLRRRGVRDALFFCGFGASCRACPLRWACNPKLIRRYDWLRLLGPAMRAVGRTSGIAACLARQIDLSIPGGSGFDPQDRTGAPELSRSTMQSPLKSSPAICQANRN
jgi:hypothetical protein